MTPDDRLMAIKDGLSILRPKRDAHKNMYKIMKNKRGLGWKRFGANWYITKKECQRTIDSIVKDYPEEYISEF